MFRLFSKNHTPQLAFIKTAHPHIILLDSHSVISANDYSVNLILIFFLKFPLRIIETPLLNPCVNQSFPTMN